VRLTAFGAGHASVGTAEVTLPANVAVTPIESPLEVTASSPTIRSLEISVPGGYTNAVAVDDLEFSSSGPPPACNATSVPSVQLTQPTDGLAVQNDEFLLEGFVTTGGAPIERAAIINNAQGGVRQGALYPSLIGAAGGKFGPVRYGGLLFPGENKLTVTATNCLGTGASRVVDVTWNPVPPPTDLCHFVGKPGPVVRVSSPAQLDDLLRRPDFSGRVIIPRDVQWKMVDCAGNPLRRIPLRSGVELVGERGEVGSRPLLYTTYKSEPYSLFALTGNDVLVEGLHFRGPKPSGDHDKKDGLCEKVNSCYIDAITVTEDAEQRLGRNVVIADNEFDQWTAAAVGLTGAHGDVTLESWNPSWARLERQDARLVRITGNYMHDNAMDGGGYGVAVGGGAYAWIEGNVFDFNRHSVAASGKAYSGYVARFNYVLQGGVKQSYYYNQHFDVHGTADDGYGGYAGEYFEIAYNTIRGAQSFGLRQTRPAFMLRGRPGNPRDHRAGVVNGAYFNNNVVVHGDLDAAVSLKMSKYATGIGEDHRKFNFHASGNRFGTDYSTEVATGDFDGDGRTDVFVANGTAWFFSRAGIRPWEYLHASNKRTHQLGFADIDNDGVTDVLYRDPSGKLGYLKSGRVDLVPLTSSPVPIDELRFGDFDGDGLTDIFYTRGGRWSVWYGRTRNWTVVGSSSFPISAFLFGEFDDVRGTDIVAVTGGGWGYSSGATRPWARLNAKRVGSFANAVAADFDGNGKTDIAVGVGQKWFYSRDGRGPLVVLRNGSPVQPYPPLNRLPIGRFDGGTRDQVVSFDLRVEPGPRVVAGNRLFVWGLGSQAFRMRSEQDMR
jgi:hypothetical protein